MDPKRKQRLDSLFEAFSILAEGKYVYLCDMREDYSRWSQNAVDYFGLPDIYMKDAGLIWEEHIHPDDRENYHNSIANIFAGTNFGHDMQYRAMATDGHYVVCTCRGVVIRDYDDKPIYFGGVIHNHGMLSYMDTVTGLRSLYGFFEDLQSMFWKQDEGTVLLVGLSSFSNVNDLYGYTFGNTVLCEFANLLQKEYMNAGAVYRMDGTKFAIISHTLTADKMADIYHKIHEKASHDFYVNGERLSLLTNAGIVHVRNFNISTETVYSCLKYVYYESKEKKLGDAVIFADELTDDNRLYIEKLNTIRNSVTEHCKGFYLCYQPIMDAVTEQLKGAEALLRWRNEEYGAVPPMQFIHVLEQDPLFPELGRWILRTAMEDGKQILMRHPNFVMNVNLSYAQLETNTFVDDVLSALEETNYPPQNLCLEITERCRLLDMDLLKRVFKVLHDKGIRLALDDFGTGYSSMGILRELEVDVVKIDREYVKDVITSSSDQSTVQFISTLAESFKADVCVEGVESKEMRDFLRHYPVSSLQGYFYSKPVPIDEFIMMYRI
ncbi:MAG: EAL domain-containing protein [Oscillospiraceae bacterium]|nr:EAL domain-containing protein [Oscillospiraceae bacterium]